MLSLRPSRQVGLGFGYLNACLRRTSVFGVPILSKHVKDRTPNHRLSVMTACKVVPSSRFGRTLAVTDPGEGKAQTCAKGCYQ